MVTVFTASTSSIVKPTSVTNNIFNDDHEAFSRETWRMNATGESRKSRG